VLVPTVVGTTDSAISRFSPTERNCYNDDVSVTFNLSGNDIEQNCTNVQTSYMFEL
jgi:hypothetical protein